MLVRAMDYQVKPCQFVTLLILVNMLLLCAWLCERKINVELLHWMGLCQLSCVKDVEPLLYNLKERLWEIVDLQWMYEIKHVSFEDSKLFHICS